VIDGRRVLAVIPARGGSKGVPRKNLRPVGGRPLLAWTIEQARAVAGLDRIVVSSDDAEILEVARAWGAETPFVRPAELAADTTPGIDPVLHAIEALPGYDYVVLLQPTSPLRRPGDIDACLRQALGRGAPACLSVTAAEPSPYWMFRMDAAGRLAPVLEDGPLPARRQDLPPVFVINGAIYVAATDWLLRHRSFVSPETIGFEMPRDRSLDLDTEEDFELLRLRLERLHGEA
jgi:N-acylneuraminate cytidylyltransferase